MKKLFLLLTLALVSTSGFAQRETFEFGVKFNYGFDDPNVGIGLLGRYNIDGHFRPELTLNYYPESDDHSAWDVNANLHYIFHITNKFKLYPLGGLAVSGHDFDRGPIDYSETTVGVNLGGGLQYNITRNLHLNAETYYQFVDDYDRGIMNFSLSYVF